MSVMQAILILRLNYVKEIMTSYVIISTCICVVSHIPVCIILTLGTPTPTLQNGDVRLVNTVNYTSTSGRLEVYYQGQWGTVCDDLFDNNAAMVVCRQLGFNPAGATAVYSSVFGRGTGTIWLDNVNCNGLEPNIDSCPHSTWGSHNCGHFEDVGVICPSKSIQCI